MRTTLELPADLMRSVKVRAAQTDRTMTEVITELLRKGLMSEGTGTPASRVRLPLVRNTRMATTEDFSPDRISAILQASEVAELASREE